MTAKIPCIDFWFSVGSTYSYLSVARIEHVTAAAGVSVNWRPFGVRRIMQEMNNRFLAGKPEKYAYMWRDIARRADMYGIPAVVPVPHPITDINLANRVAVLGRMEGWCVPYVQATYRRWFTLGQEPGSEPNLSDTLREIGQDPARVIARARGPRVGLTYEADTDRARRLGIFGAPSFVVDGELFWGDDRLEDAISWAKFGRVIGVAGGSGLPAA